MEIRELSRDECLKVLAGARLARLACSHENQPYIVPVYIAYEAPVDGEPCLYGFTTLGQKVEWMRSNPKVCVEVDEIHQFDTWVSVVVFGSYEEITDRPQGEEEMVQAQRIMTHGGYSVADAAAEHGERAHAHHILQAQAMWWEPGSADWLSRAGRQPGERLKPIYYRVRIDQVTGHRATPGSS